MSLMRATKLLMQGARPLRPQDVFATSLYTGNGGTQTITNGLDLAGKGGLNWTKIRSGTSPHVLVDSVRGANIVLQSESPDFERSTGEALTRFNGNGYAIGANGAYNRPSESYVGWSFRQADKFFAIRLIQHTTGTASTISLPSFGPIGMVIGKNRSASGNWPVWHRSLPAGNALRLNLNQFADTIEAWISVSGQTITLSGSAPSGNYVLYVFSHNANLIDCGSYVGNGTSNANGPVVTCGNGWVPQFLLIKNKDVVGEWYILDIKRGINTGNDPHLLANKSNAEVTARNLVDLTTNGFRPSENANSNGRTYIYLAIRSPT